ncbi:MULTISPECIES: Stealth CR1 domain-containing protein [Halocynthiibacter]|uniref:Stealth CR1 domain-containing protein n=1 Tax=Halocynthiibacter halioticoli TaxID=2986804 RepID=A0AAE3LSC0_9RHOB|nr:MULTISPECIES: Stealth CR1 domain-containing protein [Halocynthiibacter]MCV6825404.1 Stealth CR1 domain-containing protein [Halocynthiibacter halioticoli]MCW4058405.1 Stealth CR1 domain-containing protein [Halocynthiibacter sp. SDUM655004]
MSARPTFWFCGSTEQRANLISRLNAKHIRIFALQGRKRLEFETSSKEAISAVAYQKYVNNGVVIHGAASGIEIEFCSFDPKADMWKARRAGVESEASTTYLSTLKMVDFLGFRVQMLKNAVSIQKQCSSLRKIDLVYTWVDGSDPEWMARKRETEKQIGKFTATIDATHPTRFESHEELLYVVRSALRYFVDVGNIYIVTDQQTPLFLGDLSDRVSIIDHKDIFPKNDYLPCFNSHAIEANLHRIPNLSEHYLYLNDDVIFGSAMSAADFFDEFGRSRQFHSNAACLPNEPSSSGELAVNAAGINNRKLLEKEFGYFSFRKFKHVAFATRKSVMRQMEKDLPEAWAATLPNKFRSPEDYSIAGALYQHYAAITGKAVSSSIRYNYFDTTQAANTENAKLLMDDDWRRAQMFCVNDTLPTNESERTKSHIMSIVSRVVTKNGGQVQPLKFAHPSPPRRWKFFGPREKLPSYE